MRELHREVIIVGAGTAGLSARREVAKKTASYLLVDEGPLGTTCARVGCMPSKILIEVANAFHQSRHFAAMGIRGSRSLKVNGTELWRHVRRLRDDFVTETIEEMRPWKKHFLRETARFIDRERLRIGDRIYRADRYIVATGSTPILPKNWRDLHAELLTSDSLFDLTSLPRSLAVIGAGPVGLELAQALARLGSRVKIFAPEGCGGLTDPDLQKLAEKTLAREMSFVRAEVATITKLTKGFRINYGHRHEDFEKVLVAVGRKPRLQQIGLDGLGLAGPDGHIRGFDPTTGRITGTGIYLAGDVSERAPLLHEAHWAGVVAGANAVRIRDRAHQPLTPLKITFSSPQIAVVGRSYAELTEEGKKFTCLDYDFTEQSRARMRFQNRGLLKIYVSPKSQKILGAEIFAPGAEHLAHELALALTLKLAVKDLSRLPIYHPVLEEGLGSALFHSH